MKLGVLFSGGKDSTYALDITMQKEEVVCLITIISKNKESYMFHTPNINITNLQAEAIGIPLLKVETDGVKEKELKDLEKAIKTAKEKYHLEGIVTGAIQSIYQAKRIQAICDKLDLACINPLWMKDQVELLNELVEKDYNIIISGIFAYPFDETWLGKKLDKQIIEKLIVLKDKYEINPAGEGGELETTVLDAPFFKKKIQITDSEKRAEYNSGILIIKAAKLIDR
ncbi:MAG: TIGR00289 family protein [DPANN group archaeon]|nr:TIGR00289 family protein [DPANN group archaeon]